MTRALPAAAFAFLGACLVASCSGSGGDGPAQTGGAGGGSATGGAAATGGRGAGGSPASGGMGSGGAATGGAIGNGGAGGSGGQTAPPDAAPDRGPGGTGGATMPLDGPRADAPGGNTPDARPPADTSVPVDVVPAPDRPPADGPPISGGPGCGAGSLCLALRNAYAEAMVRAKRCTVGAAGACRLQAPGSLGCGGCSVWVNEVDELTPLRTRFMSSGCQMCFYGSPTGDHCHTVICPDLVTGACVSAAGQATCVNRGGP